MAAPAGRGRSNMARMLERTCLIDLSTARHLVLVCPHCASELRLRPAAGGAVSDHCPACGRRMEGLGGHAQDAVALLAQIAEGVPAGRLFLAAPADESAMR